MRGNIGNARYASISWEIDTTSDIFLTLMTDAIQPPGKKSPEIHLSVLYIYVSDILEIEFFEDIWGTVPGHDKWRVQTEWWVVCIPMGMIIA